MTLVDKINRFEETSQSVECFNLLFSNAPISGYNSTDIVEIGGVTSTEGTRLLSVNGNTFSHDFMFKPDTIANELYKTELYNTRENRKAEYNNRRIKNIQNAVIRPEFNTEINAVMSVEEMKLSGNEYKLVQYFRGCNSIFHTSGILSKHLYMSDKQVRNLLTKMEQDGIIVKERLLREYCMRIELTEEWL